MKNVASNQPVAARIAGRYSGTYAYSSRKGIERSQLTLSITRQKSDQITGGIVTWGDLSINLALNGHYREGCLTFVTTTANKKRIIEWSGTLRGDTAEGTFVSTDNGLLARLFGRQKETGDWKCERQHFSAIHNFLSVVRGLAAIVIFFMILGGGLYLEYRYCDAHTSPVYVSPTPIGGSNAESTTGPFYTTPNNPSYSYTEPFPTPIPDSSLNQALQDPVVQQGIQQGISFFINALLNGDETKPVDVSAYDRQDGTHVDEYHRSLPNQ